MPSKHAGLPHERVNLEDETASLLESDDDINRNVTIHSHRTLLWKIYAIVFCINCGWQMLQAAQSQIFESIYCEQWYRQHPSSLVDGINESLCKIPPVQIQVSTLKGWLESLAAAPGLLLCIPFGILADGIGRRRLGILCLTMLVLGQTWVAFIAWFGGAIDLRAAWATGLVNMFGGGLMVAELLFVVSHNQSIINVG
jgi:MFS family permease